MTKIRTDSRPEGIKVMDALHTVVRSRRVLVITRPCKEQLKAIIVQCNCCASVVNNDKLLRMLNLHPGNFLISTTQGITSRSASSRKAKMQMIAEIKTYVAKGATEIFFICYANCKQDFSSQVHTNDSAKLEHRQKDVYETCSGISKMINSHSKKLAKVGVYMVSNGFRDKLDINKLTIKKIPLAKNATA